MREYSKLFSFMEDEYYRLMLDMSKENHALNEEYQIINKFNQINQDRFLSICNEHELTGVVGAYAKQLKIDLSEAWCAKLDEISIHQGLMKEKAIQVCNAMKEAGIDIVVLKNGGIMIGMIDNPMKCPMEDIDTLIHKEDFYKANEVLLKFGFTLKFRSAFEKDNIDDAYCNGSAEYYLTLQDGKQMWLELSWRVIDGRWIRPDLEPNTNDFLATSSLVSGTGVRILSPEKNLLQVCIHTAKHSYVRAPGLRLHMDVDRIVTHCKIDWEYFMKSVEEAHVKTSTYYSLLIPSVLFGTVIPDRVLLKLKPKNDKIIYKLLAKAGLPNPKQEKFNKLQFLRFQTALYDYKSDLIKVLYPGSKWMKEKYRYESSILTPIYILIRGFDLLGIRKEK